MLEGAGEEEKKSTRKKKDNAKDNPRQDTHVEKKTTAKKGDARRR